MSSPLTRSLLLVAAASHGIAQFVPPPTSLKEVTGHLDIPVRYKEVPTGICELDPDVKSYSGYVDVAEDQHIFFWFFEARNQDPEEADLTVWINGGPGSSSMIGLWEELGPCRYDPFGNVLSNEYSWSNVSNLLVIDQPTQVGFSYSKPVDAWQSNDGHIVTVADGVCPDYAPEGSCGTYSYPNITLTANSTANAAPNFYRTLQGFMGAFPQYSRNAFHFATESYGGHYGPIFNKYIEEQNAKNISGAKEIQLQSVLIGNGWFDPLLQYQAYYNFTVFPGNTYDWFPFNESIESMFYNNVYGPGNCVDKLKDCYATQDNVICNDADSFCAYMVESVYDDILGRDEYDSRELTPDPFPYGFYLDYLNSPKLQEAIGAYTNFSTSSNVVGQAFENTGDDSREAGTVEAIRYLISKNITVAIYAGDSDYNCNWLGGEAVVEEIAAPGYADAGYTDLITSDNITHGQVKQAGKFSFTRIYESGHEVPFYQPLAALELFERVIKGYDVKTGKDIVQAEYVTQGTPKSTYHQGNSTFQWTVTPSNATYDVNTNKPGAAWQPPQQAVLMKRSFKSRPVAGRRGR
ncbi:alpha/beta-hydrolase [Hypoxylon trugodes]|uniref:alpha/beta-hydrolase n=1 Tax=Hypoxylon trugodes TaxID=326681 RepID=UPI00219893DA|nr:alpha/beta-hydrolase [Hypoxylon trugodes]KAI1384421.1 alpha/beta-hydrolase [Hypoxylon trugodes]